MQQRSRFFWITVCALTLIGCSDGSSVDPNLGQVDVASPPTDVSKNETTTDTAEKDLLPSDLGSGSSCEEGEGCLGEPCNESGDCLSGICSMHLGEYVCSKTCDEDCPQGWSCKLVTSGGDSQYVCVSNYSHLCLPCADSGDCSDEAGLNACVQYAAGGTFCGGACELGVPCPDGYSCQEVDTAAGTKSFQCVSVWGECSCSSLAIESALATPCDISNPEGTCSGFRVCTEEGLSDCDAQSPIAEICNGIDDNCNGQTDEGTCDDGNACTVDTCNGEGGCAHEPINGGECVDGSTCTQEDHCEEGVCVGVPKVCDDGEGCTDDSCDPDFGCVYTPNFTNCDDGDACTVGDTCKDGLCTAGPTIACDDGNPCTDDACDANGCSYTANEAACDDGNACTTGSICSNATCLPGTPTDCDDANACTNDSCVPKSGCAYTGNTIACDDGNPCTLGDTCADASCQPGKGELACNDGNPCTDDACGADGCTYTPNDAECDDGNACTTNSNCSEGACAPGSPAVCDDNNDCTDDTCEPNAGCTHKANTIPCDDGSPCTLGDACADGSCQGGAGTLNCDDGNPCTDDSCEDAGCLHTANEAPCDDGNPCSEASICKEGACSAQAATTCDDDNDCTTDFCNPLAGCVHEANTLPCNDGNTCSLQDTCTDGQCQSGAVTLNCEDGNPCTDDGCDALKGCTFTANEAECDDLNTCTTSDTCKSGACVGAGSLECDDKNPCTIDSCLPNGGCQQVSAEGQPCTDGDICTASDTCSESQCKGGQALACDDGNPCTIDSCDSKTGCSYADAGGECDDGNACTITDTCAGGTCLGSGTLDCLDDNPCTDDGCDAALGCTHVANANPCDDGDLCTKEDTCNDGDCEPGEPLVCDDGLFCNGKESCESEKGCVPGVAPNVGDDIDCTIDSCDEDTDTVVNTTNDALCDKGGLCKSYTCDAAQGCQVGTANNCCGNNIQEDGEACDDGNNVLGDGCDASCNLEAHQDCQAILNNEPNAGDGMYLIDPDGNGGFGPFMAECVMSIEGGGWTRFNWLKQAYPGGKDPLEFEVAQCDPNSAICRGRIPAAANPKEFLVRDLSEGTYGAWKFDGSTISNAVVNALQKKQQSCHNNSNKFQPYATNSLELYCANGGEDGCDSFYYTSGGCAGINNWGIHWDGDNHWCSAAFKLGSTKSGGCGDGDYGFMDDCDCSSESGALYYR